MTARELSFHILKNSFNIIDLNNYLKNIYTRRIWKRTPLLILYWNKKIKCVFEK